MLSRPAPRVVRSAEPAGEGPVGDQRGRPVRVGNRERDAQAPPVGDTEQGSPLRAGRVHHRPDVVHPLG